MDQLKFLYLTFVLVVAIQRILELFISKRNNKVLLSQGAKEFGKEHFIYMKLVHTSWLIACFVGGLYYVAPTVLPYYALFLFLCGQILRYLAISGLKNRWTANIMILPGLKPVQSGIYKYVRHPNYLGVILEIMALPLMWDLYYIALIFSVLNLIILKVRIGTEENALEEYNQYKNNMKSKKRFLPGLF